MKPIVLDPFCGEGGSAWGWHLAGFDVFGVDDDPKRLELYPFDVEADAVEFIAKYGHGYTLVAGSPPCTGYTQGTVALPDRLTRYDRLIGLTREAMISTGRPYVIENVESRDARRELRDPLMLCGFEFGLTAVDDDGTLLHLKRHRLFESNLPLMGAGGCPGHPKIGGPQIAGAYGGARRDKIEARTIRKGGYVPKNVDVLRELLGTPWMSEQGCFLSIPPVYTEFIGEQLMAVIEVAA